MAADYDRISKWICRRPEEATHMLVVCDTWDYDDYPVYFPSELNEPSDTGASVEVRVRTSSGRS